MITNRTCPACNYTRQPTDITPDWECPKCQKAYRKSTRANLLQDSVTNALPTSRFTQVFIDGDNFLYEGSKIKFDGSQDVDPIAIRAKWYRITDRVGEIPPDTVTVSAARLEFSSIKSSKFLSWIFMLFGVSCVPGLLFPARTMSAGKILSVLIICFVFVIVGYFIPSLLNKSIIFDKLRGCFFKYGRMNSQRTDINSLRDAIHFEEIHALQLIYWESAAYQKAGGKIIELNLVLRDSSRVNVVFYINEKKAREHAATLANFLGKPVWDAIETTRNYWISRR